MDVFVGPAVALLVFAFGVLAGVVGYRFWLRVHGNAVVTVAEYEEIRAVALPSGVVLGEELFTDADETAVVYLGKLGQATAVIVDAAADDMIAAFPLTASGRDIIPTRARAWEWSPEIGTWVRVHGKPVDIVEAAIRKGFFADLRRRLREEFAQILSVVPADAQPRDPEQT